MLPELLENIPTVVGVCGRRMVDFRFFKFHRALVARGVDMIWNTVALHVVNDPLYTMLRQYENEEDSMVNPRPAPELLEPFVVDTRTPPQDSPTAFLDFPDSPPLNAQQIFDYFEQ
jgi:hypothetical protein